MLAPKILPNITNQAETLAGVVPTVVVPEVPISQTSEVPVSQDSSVSQLGLADYRSKTFQDSITLFPPDIEKTSANIDDHARKFGFRPESYQEELTKYINNLESGDDAIPDSTSPGRILGRAVGETVRGVTDLAGFFVKQASGGEDLLNTFSDLTFELQNQYVSDDLVRIMKRTFDPAHPEDIGTILGGYVPLGENLAGHVASYLIPGLGTVKGLSLAQKGITSFTKGKIFGPSLKQVDDEIRKILNPKLGTVTKIKPAFAIQAAKARKSAKIRSVIGTTAKYELGFAGSASIIDSPDENFVNLLIQSFPETMEFLEPLKTNPNDTEAQKRLQGFLNNIGLGVVTGPIFSSVPLIRAFRQSGEPSAESIAHSVSRIDNATVGSSTTPLKELGEITTGKKATRWQKIKGRFSSRMGTNDELLAATVRMEQAGPAALMIAKATSRELKKAAQKDFGKKVSKTDDVIDTMNSALSGNAKALSELASKPNVTRVLGTMRKDIDDLSKSISDNLPSGELKIRIDKNYNSYLNRTYKAFDDPAWKGLKDPFFQSAKGLKIREAAEQALVKKGFHSKADRYQVMEWIAKGMPQSTTKDIVGLNRSQNKEIKNFIETLSDYSVLKGSSPLTGRRLEKPFRALMGEVKSPFENYAKTFEKLTVIKAEQDYLKEVIKNLKKYEMGEEAVGRTSRTEGYVPFKSDILNTRLNRLGSGYKRGTQIADDGTTSIPKSTADDLSAPFEKLVQDEFGFSLDKLYINPVYAQAIKNGTEIMAPSGPLIKNWIKYKALSQIMKTVASPATHARNVMGNNIIMLANGMLPMSLRGETSAFIRRLGDMETREMAESIAEAIRVGVIDSGVKAGTVRSQLKDIAQDPKGYLNKVLDKSAVTRVGKKVSNKTFRLYQDEDNLYKFMHYNKTKNYLRNAGIPENEIIEMAAQRTRDLMPNYNLVSRQLKHMRRWPVGDFLSFPAEMIRVTANLGKYTLRDIRSGNPTLMREGMKRLAGMTVAGLGTDIAANYSMDMFGITDEEADKLNRTVFSYEQDVPKLFLSPIYSDDNDHSVIQYVNFGPIDPFDYVKYAGRAVHNALLTNEEVDWNDVKFRIFIKQISPFAKPSMIFQAALKVAGGAKNFDSQREEDIGNMLKIAVNPFEPGFVPAVQRYFNYYRSLEELNKNRTGQGAIGPYGQSLGEGDKNLAANLLGVRVQTHDLDSSMARQVGEMQRQVKKSKQAFTRSSAYSDKGRNDPEGLVKAYVNSQEIKYRDMKELRQTIKPYLKLTPDGRPLTLKKLEQILSRDSRYSVKDISLLEQAMNNVFVPDIPTDDNIQFLLKSGKIIESNDPAMNLIYEYAESINNTRLED